MYFYSEQEGYLRKVESFRAISKKLFFFNNASRNFISKPQIPIQHPKKLMEWQNSKLPYKLPARGNFKQKLTVLIKGIFYL